MAFVRRDIWTLEPDDPIVEWYRKGVAVMKEREATEVLSWEYQAAIHGIPTRFGQRPLWNQCQHAQWFFLPWHRMYVLRFEAIVRAAIEGAGGPKDWALPYWNYGLGGESATLPLPFREPEVNGEANALYVEERQQAVNRGAELPAELVSAVKALERPHFIGAAEFGGGEHEPSHQRAGLTGVLEETPHNNVHVLVGGRNGWMSFPELAAKDPIFWLHHTNIDRLWVVWNETRGHADPNEENWKEQRFELFDIHGDKVPMRCGEVESVERLGYEYDPTAPTSHVPFTPLPPRPALSAEGGGGVIDKPHMVGATDRPITLVGEPVEVEIPIDAKEAGELAPAQHVYLNTEDVEGERNPGTVYGVYVELPPKPSPEAVAAHHVGNLAFFGIERTDAPAGDENPHGARFAVEITAIAQGLAAHGEWAGHRLRVAIKPLSLKPREPGHRDLIPSPAHPEWPIKIGRISVFYDA